LSFDPKHLGVGILSKKHLQKIGGKLNTSLEKSFLNEAERTQLKGIIEQIKNVSPMSPNLKIKWKKFTQHLDRNRNQSLRKTLPELQIYLDADLSS